MEKISVNNDSSLNEKSVAKQLNEGVAYLHLRCYSSYSSILEGHFLSNSLVVRCQQTSLQRHIILVIASRLPEIWEQKLYIFHRLGIATFRLSHPLYCTLRTALPVLSHYKIAVLHFG